MAAVAVRRRFRSAILGDYDAGGRAAGRASQLVLVGHRTVQPYLEKVGFGRAGTAHVGRAQAGVARDGAAHVGLAQVRLGEVGVAQVGLEQPRIPQISSSSDRMLLTSTPTSSPTSRAMTGPPACRTVVTMRRSRTRASPPPRPVRGAGPAPLPVRPIASKHALVAELSERDAVVDVVLGHTVSLVAGPLVEAPGSLVVAQDPQS